MEKIDWLKEFKAMVLTAFFFAVVGFSAYSVYQSETADPRLREVETQAAIDSTLFWAENKPYLVYSVLGLSAVCGLIVAMGYYTRASTHVAKIGESEIPIRHRDLSNMAPILTGLTTARQLEAHEGGVEKAFQMYLQLAKMQESQLRRLSSQSPAIAELTDGGNPSIVPPFAHLLRSGEIAPGNDMVLAYIDSQPQRGSFMDIYSSAVAGESGSGKTSTMLFLVGSGLIATDARFIVIDPHYPHPNSLGAKIAPLVDAGLVECYTYIDDMRAALKAITSIITNRLKQDDTSTYPVVLVIDELRSLMNTSIAGEVEATMSTISTEGRKCGVYMLAASQTWLAAMFKKGSLARDTLTSAYVHRIKPKQAQVLLQDKAAETALRSNVKKAGEVLFCPVRGEPLVGKMPMATEQDMREVVRLCANGGEVRTALVPTTPHCLPVTGKGTVAGVDTAQIKKAAQNGAEALTPETCKAERLRQELSFQALADAAGLRNKMQVWRYEGGSETILSEEEKARVTAVLWPEKIALNPKVTNLALWRNRP